MVHDTVPPPRARPLAEADPLPAPVDDFDVEAHREHKLRLTLSEQNHTIRCLEVMVRDLETKVARRGSVTDEEWQILVELRRATWAGRL